ncbi:MAG: spondin domain-containing protein [Parashewanella sp.]
MNTPFAKKTALAFAVMGTLVLTGCPSSNNKSEPAKPDAPKPPAAKTYDYKVTVSNLTPKQPFSPITLLAHKASDPIWTAGAPASVALEKLAEAGANSDFRNQKGVYKLVSGRGHVDPGMSQTNTISLTPEQVDRFTVLTMLINTNDAFTGVGNYNLKGLKVGEKVSFRANSYDSGTEKNSEERATIPGPAGGGQGFNAERDDINKVYIHSGAITQAGGLADSALTPAHRWDNPTMSVVIERTK